MKTPFPTRLPCLALYSVLVIAVAGRGMAATAAKSATPSVKAPHLPLTVSPGVEAVRLPEPAVKGGVMSKLKDGRVMLLYAAKDVYAPVGTSALRALYSSDGGKTWGGARDVLTDKAYNPGRPTFLRARDGRLWLIYYGFVRSAKENGGKSDLWITATDDEGKTWQTPRRLFEGYTAGQRHAIQTKDGRLVIVFSHAALPEGRNISASLVSTDNGKTWRKSNAVELPGKGSHSGALEPTVVELKDGRLWMLIRHPGLFHESFSSDGGMAWSDPAPTRITSPKPVGGSPASLIRLSDGRLAMAWNPLITIPADATPWQKHGRGLLAVAVSSDDGRTWTPPATIGETTYACYPHLFEHAPGELLLSTGLLKAAGYDGDVVVFRFAAKTIFK